MPLAINSIVGMSGSPLRVRAFRIVGFDLAGGF